MAPDAFQQEKKLVKQAEDLLAQGGEVDFQPEYKKLLKAYKRMLKVTRRVVSVSDSNEHKLKSLHSKITKQQEELGKTHKTLAQHAEALEGRVESRTKELVVAQEKLSKLIDMGIALSKERNLARFKELILTGAKELTNADGGALLLRTDEDTLAYELFDVDSLDLHFGGASGLEVPYLPLDLRDAKTGRPDYYNLLTHAVLTERTINIPNIQESTDFDFSNLLEFDQDNKYRSQSYLAVPLKPNQGQVVGLLLLSNARVKGTSRAIPFSDELAGLVEGLAAQAAVALVNQQLMDSQWRLLDSLIKLISGAIDAKSPYTGDHCGKVAIVGEMLARAACEAEDGPLSEFDMTEVEWREFNVACWMHDCGKITTPEYVVDKATKLETIYNRIHEIRTRFEVLLRDEIIKNQQALLEGNGDGDKLKAQLEENIAALKEDFAFVADCNAGGEYMAPEKVERLQVIAQRTWERHFDDRLGISADELLRVKKNPARSLPAVENLLADKKEHVIPRHGGKAPYDTEKYGIQIDVPEDLFNQGELYNLAIAKGTLTEEERFKIQEHVIQTIVMLDKLPFPRELSQVDEIAGSHHETMIGNGYPRRISQTEMSTKAKILAIADIFEALTASDRPYKKAKTLSEAIRIMSFMRNDEHIDPELFDLLLTSGVYTKYAKWNLKQNQIDKVDVAQFLSKE